MIFNFIQSVSSPVPRPSIETSKSHTRSYTMRFCPATPSQSIMKQSRKKEQRHQQKMNKNVLKSFVEIVGYLLVGPKLSAVFGLFGCYWASISVRQIMVIWGIPENILQNTVQIHWPSVDWAPQSKVMATSHFCPISPLKYQNSDFWLIGMGHPKRYTSHSQMLGKFEYTLPAKFWRLVGCTEMLSW